MPWSVGTPSGSWPSSSPTPSPTSLAKAATGVSRSASNSVHTGTTVFVVARAWNWLRSGEMRMLTARRSVVAEAAEEAGVVAGVAGAAALLLHLEQQRVAVAVVVGLADVLGLAAGVALAPQLLTTAAPV